MELLILPISNYICEVAAQSCKYDPVSTKWFIPLHLKTCANVDLSHYKTT